MLTTKRNHLATLLSLLLVAIGGAPAAQAAPPARAPANMPSKMEAASCKDMLKPPGESPFSALIPEPDKDTECGYVQVPEQHARPGARQIKLAVVILRATGPAGDRLADPLFMLQGGPGGSTIEAYGIQMRANVLRGKRDIVLFDQRGTGKSQPALLCPEAYELTVATIEKRLDYDESLRLQGEALLRCRARLVKQGIDLNAFNSLENASDVDTLRKALGYERINLYGVSYGTLLALHVMRAAPGMLRSVIIDSVVPPQLNFGVEAPRSETRAFGELFKACADDPVCNRDYPNLEQEFFTQVDRLNATPLRARMSDPATGASYNAVIDGDALLTLVFQSMYAKNLIPLLPQLIYDIKAGNPATLGTLGSLFVFEKSVATGMYFSVICAEDADYDPQAALSPELRSEVAKNAVKDAANFQQICRGWNVVALPATVDDPVVSDVPTLVLGGRFDPITPPANGALAARTLSNSYVYTFPDTGHGAFLSDDCATRIVGEFITSPGLKPDSACMNAIKPPAFVAQDALIRVPVLGEILNSPPRDRRVELSVLVAALLILLTGVILLPLGWLARILFKKNHPTRMPPFLANLMPWLVVLDAALITGFVGALFYSAFMAAAGEDYSFLVGVSSDLRPLFYIPVVVALLTVMIVLGAIAGWTGRAWGWGRKLYRTALALAAVLALDVLVLWGLVGLPLAG